MTCDSYSGKDLSGLPGWTSPQPGILEPLRLPEATVKGPPPTDQDVSCLLCDEVYPHPGHQLDLLRHLLLHHKFVIADVNMIGDFPAYIKYWKNKFLEQPVAAYCTTLTSEVKEEGEGGGSSSRTENFSLLSDIVPEDRELRRKLQMDRLDQVLLVQEAERNSLTFHRGCLFCRQTFTQHAELFDHMAFDHNFSVGQPDNLVFVERFLDLLQAKLDELVCLFCEKVFKSREVLKEHMRKKAHKKINPQNRIYDQFYLVNYLEFGKNWEDLSREEEELPPTGFDPEKEEDADWSDWRGDVGGTVCLFCPATYVDKDDLLNHMLEVHGFDFVKIKTEQKLNFYLQIKLINYIRRCVHLHTCIGCGEVFPSGEEMQSHLSWSNHYEPSPRDWNQPQFYFPTYENDNLLCVLEDDEEEEEDQGFCSDASSAASSSVAPVLPEEVAPGLVEESILREEAVRQALLPSRKITTADRDKLQK